jgi:hypothetical protein
MPLDRWQRDGQPELLKVNDERAYPKRAPRIREDAETSRSRVVGAPLF